MKMRINKNYYLTEGFIYKECGFLYYVKVQERNKTLQLLHSTKNESDAILKCFKQTFKNERINNGDVFYFQIYHVHSISQIMYVKFTDEHITQNTYDASADFSEKINFARATVRELIHIKKANKKIIYQ